MVTFDLVERTPEEQRAWMSEHSGVYALLVAEIDGAVVGFASLSPYRTRPGYSTTAEDSIYVAPLASRRRCRQGAALGARRPGPAARISRADCPHRRRPRGVDRSAPRVRFRSNRNRARDRQEVRPLARRLPDASAALTTRRRSRTAACHSVQLNCRTRCRDSGSYALSPSWRALCAGARDGASDTDMRPRSAPARAMRRRSGQGSRSRARARARVRPAVRGSSRRPRIR